MTDPGALRRSFNLTASQERSVRRALSDAPAGALDVMREAREYGDRNENSGASFLIHRLKAGEHFERQLAIDPISTDTDKRRITGWRWTRGSHGETWLRDPQGRDVPPKGYAGGG